MQSIPKSTALWLAVPLRNSESLCRGTSDFQNHVGTATPSGQIRCQFYASRLKIRVRQPAGRRRLPPSEAHRQVRFVRRVAARNQT